MAFDPIAQRDKSLPLERSFAHAQDDNDKRRRAVLQFRSEINAAHLNPQIRASLFQLVRRGECRTII
jgi:hypothetical protein